MNYGLLFGTVVKTVAEIWKIILLHDSVVHKLFSSNLELCSTKYSPPPPPGLAFSMPLSLSLVLIAPGGAWGHFSVIL